MNEVLAASATFIKRLDDFRGDARLYHLDKPLQYEDYEDGERVQCSTDHIVISACYVLGIPETYIFASDSDGKITNWCERTGSFKGSIDHTRALNDAGYLLSNPQDYPPTIRPTNNDSAKYRTP